MSVKSSLTSGASVCPENTGTYSAGDGGQNICCFFFETALLPRSSTAPLKAIRTVGHFPLMRIICGRAEEARPVTFARSGRS